MATKRKVSAKNSKGPIHTESSPNTHQRPVHSSKHQAVGSGQQNSGNAEHDGSLKDDPKLDRRIIEGMLHDRDALMTEMDARGIGANHVLRRAAELGLSEALIRQVRGVAADLAGERSERKLPIASLGARTCLSCDRIFLSAGPGNRLCMRCRTGDAGLAQL
jgi:hypothetical protein